MLNAEDSFERATNIPCSCSAETSAELIIELIIELTASAAASLIACLSAILAAVLAAVSPAISSSSGARRSVKNAADGSSGSSSGSGSGSGSGCGSLMAVEDVRRRVLGPRRERPRPPFGVSVKAASNAWKTPAEIKMSRSAWNACFGSGSGFVASCCVPPPVRLPVTQPWRFFGRVDRKCSARRTRRA